MSIWYETSRWGSEPIKAVEVVRSTDKSVYVFDGMRKRETRQARYSQYGSYFPTWEEAYASLMQQANEKIERAKDSLIQAEKHRAKIAALTKPDPAP